MKQFKFLAMALAALTMFSCSKEEANGGGEELSKVRKVTVQFENAVDVQNRAIGGPAAVTKTKLFDACIYFVSDAGVVVRGVPVSEVELTAPVVCNKIPVTATKVYVVANYLETGQPDTKYPEVSGGALTLAQLQTNLKSITLASQNAAPVETILNYQRILMDGTGTIVGGDDNKTATVMISSALSRLELTQFEITADGTAAANVSYKLEGVYINNVYRDFTLGGTGTNLLLSNAGTDFEKDGTHPAYAKDWSDAGFSQTNLVTKPAVDGSVWGYNFFPAGTPDTGTIESPLAGVELPHIVLRINSLVVPGTPTINEPRYVTVQKFQKAGSTAQITAFERNKCYKITGISAHYTAVDPDPEVETMNVTATVDVTPWSTVDIEPM